MFTLMLALLTLGAADTDEPKLKFQPRKPEDSAEVRKEKDRTVFVVTSKSGIGGVLIELDQGKWPRDVTLRMTYGKERGFQMLESFSLETNRIKVSGSKGASGKMPFGFVGPDGKSEMTAGHLNVTVKEREGALEVTLPAHLLTGAKEVKVEWIDAFRR